MNRIYRSIWNKYTNTFTAVSELTHAAGNRYSERSNVAHSVRLHFLKPLCAALLLAGGISAPAISADLPTAGQIVVGSGSISQAANAMTIQQHSAKLGIDWHSFNIGQGHSVNFVQPNANAIALNRVVGSDPSSIMGNLIANGQVFLINPNGVLFGSSAQVNVGSLVASTLNMSNADFENGRYVFKGNGGNAAILNQGRINADGGVVALLGGQVSNEGLIQAKGGTVALASGNKMTLDFAGDGLVSLAIDEATRHALIANHHLIEAEGGQVILTAQAADSIASVVINQAGVIRANSTIEKDGKIILASNGNVNVTGSLDVSGHQGGEITITGKDITLTHANFNANGDTGGGTIKMGGDYQGSGSLPHAANVTIDSTSTLTANANQTGQGGRIIAWSDGKTIAQGNFSAQGKTGNGGLVETSGKEVDFNGIRVNTLSANGKAGEWLIDPTDLTVDVTAATTINTNLNTSNVTLQTTAGGASGTGIQSSGAGDIHINAAISWSGDTIFALDAYNNININAAITATGTNSGLNLKYGSNASTTADYNVNAPITLGGSNATLNINNNNYVLIRDMTQFAAMDNVTNYYALVNDIDASSTTYANSVVGTFTADSVFTGLGHTISNFTLNYDATTFSPSKLGLFGDVANSTLRDLTISNANVGVTGNIATLGGGNMGILAGQAYGVIKNIHTSGVIEGSNVVGGLVGFVGDATVSHSSTSAQVNGRMNVGGLIGRAFYLTGRNLTATGAVSALEDLAGGLIGELSYATLDQVTATGNVSGVNQVGGLIGRYYDNVSTTPLINNAVASGNISGQNYLGGLIGSAEAPGLITNSRASGNVTASDVNNTGTAITQFIGGLIGFSELNLTNVSASGNVFSGIGLSFVTDVGIGGLVGYSTGATIQNATSSGEVGFTNNAQLWNVGGLIGTSVNDIISDSSSTSTVSGIDTIGGLIGYASNVTLRNSSANAIVNGGYNTGGLIGWMMYGSGETLFATGTVNGTYGVGGLIGTAEQATLTNVYATGKVVGTDERVGGLIGGSDSMTIDTAYATGDVEGLMIVGGLIGHNDDDLSTISNVYATGNVIATEEIAGGLIGEGGVVILDRAYATGNVSAGISTAGGLLGNAEESTITNAYALGTVTTPSLGGGFAGILYDTSVNTAFASGNVIGNATSVDGMLGGFLGAINKSTLTNVYATGNVSGTVAVGGLVGFAQDLQGASSIDMTYASGSVSDLASGAALGGLLGGKNPASTVTVARSYYATTDANGSPINTVPTVFGIAKTRAELMQVATFADWNIDNVGGTTNTWRVYEGDTTPWLRYFLTPTNVTITGTSNKVYDGTIASGIGQAFAADNSFIGDVNYATTSADIGVYSFANGNLILRGLFSNQLGYDIIAEVAEVAIVDNATPPTPTPTPTPDMPDMPDYNLPPNVPGMNDSPANINAFIAACDTDFDVLADPNLPGISSAPMATSVASILAQLTAQDEADNILNCTNQPLEGPSLFNKLGAL